jgi:hypothetical protein
MKLSSVKALFEALRAKDVRFLVAGGLAVNAYGYLRFTKDADLVIELVPQNIARAFEALKSVGYKPNVPITAGQFADEAQRTEWIRAKGMQVLQFWSDAHRETPVDIFVDVPFDFAAEISHAPTREFPGVGPVPLVSLRTLIRMKEIANRPEDLIDLDHLRRALSEEGNA